MPFNAIFLAGSLDRIGWKLLPLLKNKGGNGIYPKRVDAVCSFEFRTAAKILSSRELDLAYAAFSYELRLLASLMQNSGWTRLATRRM